MTDSIVRTVERKGEIAATKPQRFATVQRAAEQLSRRNADAAIVEVMMEAMQRLTLLAYEKDSDGFCNVDEPTGKLLIPAPWGKVGYKRWGITLSESICLREMMQQRQIGRDGRAPGLWIYDRDRRCWRLNLYDFDTLADGQKYWKQWPLGIGEYRTARSKRLRV